MNIKNKNLLLEGNTKLYFSQNLDKVKIGEDNLTLKIVKFNRWQEESIQVLYKDILLGYFDGFDYKYLDLINSDSNYILKLEVADISKEDMCIYVKYYVYN